MPHRSEYHAAPGPHARAAGLPSRAWSPARAEERAAARPTRVDRIDYGVVPYDGPAYLMLQQCSAELGLRELRRLAADLSGSTRYGSPGQPTWYVSLDPDSALAEMCFHVLTEGAPGARPFACAMYRLRVRGRFADLHGRERRHPELIADDYAATQGVAARVRASRLDGVLYPSARSNGFCIAAFTARVLCSARLMEFVAMRVHSASTVKVCTGDGGHWRSLHRGRLLRRT